VFALRLGRDYLCLALHGAEPDQAGPPCLADLFGCLAWDGAAGFRRNCPIAAPRFACTLPNSGHAGTHGAN
jgi:hypothetical protein